jgi:SAM-dependent methyltransferase
MGSKQPKLVLRESCVGDFTRTWPAGSFLEMGAGTGYMTALFLERGFTGAGYDLGEDSRERMRSNLARFGERIQVVDDVQALAAESFDYLLAFEVLEHIEEDAAALVEWSRFLRSGGRLLISVPAHARKFGKSDELVGHVRRYEKAGLRRLLEQAGYEQIHIANYGFPITELTRPISNWLVRGDRSYDHMSATERSIRSAQARPRVINRLLRVFSGSMVRPFCHMQRWFYRFDWGDGYVATAAKRANEVSQPRQ